MLLTKQQKYLLAVLEKRVGMKMYTKDVFLNFAGGFKVADPGLDLAIIKADVRCAAAGVYTTNKVYGAPIKVDRAHLVDGHAQAVLVNSGNANTCAANGVDLANECCALVAQQLGIAAEDVLPASTGVIGLSLIHI